MVLPTQHSRGELPLPPRQSIAVNRRKPHQQRTYRVGNAWDTFTASRHHFKVQRLIGKRRLLIDAPGKAFQPHGSTSWQNDDHINVVIDLLRALYAHGSTGNRILPQDAMLLCPYKAQVKRVVERFEAEGVQYHRCLTVDSAEGSVSNVVIFMLTKPKTNSLAEVGFLSNYQRLNVALTRAKKLMVAVGNLTIWNAAFVNKASNGGARYLAGFLKDVVDKRDVLNWVGVETVERTVGPQLGTADACLKPGPATQGGTSVGQYA